jgi:GntR family transcriptional regulator/MocR family aminotransferase
MSPKRRQAVVDAAKANDVLIIEDDYECEINYLQHPMPALRGMDESGRVIYVASLSKVLAPGLRLGFIVADPPFIQRARALRRTLMNHPPRNNQRAVAYFLSLGHYDALMLRLGRTLKERRLALRDALNWMRGVPMEISPEVGGTTYWVRTPDDFDVEAFAHAAAQRGILIEPVRHYYADPERAENCFRMGVTSLPLERIRPGVERLVELIRSQVRDYVEKLSTSKGEWLRGDALTEVMAGATILYREVDGSPCTIKYHKSGLMTGVLGYSNEEQDQGRWCIEDDRFWRQWSRWNYGEERRYSVVLDGELLKLFNDDGQIVDSMFILRGSSDDAYCRTATRGRQRRQSRRHGGSDRSGHEALLLGGHAGARRTEPLRRRSQFRAGNARSVRGSLSRGRETQRRVADTRLDPRALRQRHLQHHTRHQPGRRGHRALPQAVRLAAL